MHPESRCRWAGPLTILCLLLSAPTAQVLAAAAQDTPPTEIRVEPAALEIEVGKSAIIAVSVLDAAGSPVEAETIFFARPRRALTVTEEGVVTAHRPGSHRVMVIVPVGDSGPDGALRAVVEVAVPSPPLVSMHITDGPERVYAGTRTRLRLEVIDESGARREDAAISWDSTDSAVAEVDHFGYLVAHATGEAGIEAAAETLATAIDVRVEPNPVSAVTIGSEIGARNATGEVRAGDVVFFSASAFDSAGSLVGDIPVEWAFRAHTDQAGIGEPGSGVIDQDGRFVADLPGEYTIMATAGGVAASTTLAVVPRNVERGLELVGHGPVRDRFTSDLWVWEGADGRDYALTGTWSASGHAYLWDVTDPGNMSLVDTIKVDARTVNDVKVSEDGTIAIISREGASNRRNGLVILDVSDPASGMKVLSRYDDELTGGVHNVFIHDGHVYALSAGRRYDIINIEDPANPYRVGRFELDTPGHSIHDVWVEDGIAYSSNWDDGVVAVDVGGGGQGGSPRNPVMLGSYTYPSGWNHAAFPYASKSSGKRYVFAGDEAGLQGVQPGYQEGLDLMAGYIHVIEWDQWDQPRQVARYRLPEGGSHNLWVEDDILYIAYYQGGLRVVDVSGELMGDLYRQGREIGYFLAWDPDGWIPNVAMTWGPQPYKGNIFFSDMHSGLWAVRIRPDSD